MTTSFLSTDQAKLALAVDAYCNGEFRPLTSNEEMLTGLKFAAMIRMGITDPALMIAAVEGSERFDIDRVIAMARMLSTERDQQRILGAVERGARAIVDAHTSRERAR